MIPYVNFGVPFKNHVTELSSLPFLTNSACKSEISLLCNASLAEGDERIMLGRVVMLEDREHGGVTSRTYLNVTLRTCITVYTLHSGADYLRLTAIHHSRSLCFLAFIYPTHFQWLPHGLVWIIHKETFRECMLAAGICYSPYAAGSNTLPDTKPILSECTEGKDTDLRLKRQLTIFFNVGLSII